jgi:GTPase SAR1 family protein
VPGELVKEVSNVEPGLRGFIFGTGTVLVIILLVFGLRIGRNLLVKHQGSISDSSYWVMSRFLRRSLQLHLNARRYNAVTLNAGNSNLLQIPGKVGVQLEIEKSFINLTLNSGVSEVASFSHANVWESGLRVRVIGDPGSGKSTLVKRLLRDECKRGLKDPQSARLPILVDLKTFVPPMACKAKSEMAEWALKDLEERVARVPGYKVEQLFEFYAQESGLLVLLDGLDEVASNDYRRVVGAVSAIGTRLQEIGPNNAILVTMRKHFYEQTKEDLDETFPRVLTIRSFSSNDIYEFITRWPFAVDQRSFRANEIYGELVDHPNLNTFHVRGELRDN